MANLTYNGQRLLFPGGGILDYTPPQGITGLAIWNGYTDFVDLSTSPDVSGDIKASFYLTINSNMPVSSTNNVAQIFFFFPGGVTDVLGVGVYKSSSNFYIAANSFTNSNGLRNKRSDNLSSFLDEEIFVEIVKSTEQIESISINGISSTLFNYTDISYNDIQRKVIGPILFEMMNYPVDNYLLRDLKIYDDPNGTNTLTHYWKGYPNGNQNTAWVDQVGSINGTINGSPGVTS